jgi:hypothetical protein
MLELLQAHHHMLVVLLAVVRLTSCTRRLQTHSMQKVQLQQQQHVLLKAVLLPDTPMALSLRSCAVQVRW